jgi:Ca-activated chloride channel family protein
MKGQVKDETGNLLQNAVILLHSTGYVYYSGSEGTFGIITNKQFDTITISLEGFQKQKRAVNASSFIDIKMLRSTTVNSSRMNKLASITQNLKRETQQQWFTGDETYASLVANQFINAASYPTTGLSLNVDKASYSNIRRFLTLNTPVPPDAVRLEEMINYFNFNYSEPKGDNVFGLHSVLTECPWNKNNQLLFAQINSRKISFDSLPASHLVFLIDVSGSMDMPGRLPLLKSAFKALVLNLRAKDSVSIIVYGGTVGIAMPITGGDRKDEILKTIDSLQAGGSTPGESGIKLAYSVARNHYIKHGNNRIILATDGDFNVGLKTDEELEQMISVQRQSGIYLTCLGIGMGNYKDSKIQTLAQKGNGNFAYIDSYAEAEKLLLKEFTQTLYSVADDAYLNVGFDPAYVKEYRLIGFDNKVGAIKDTQAIIEGGDIGPAYSSLVAFEIVPSDKALAAMLAGSAYQPVRFSLQYRLPAQLKSSLFTSIPEMKFVPFLQAAVSYRFAASVILFGELLRGSKFVKDTNWSNVLQMAAASADMQNFSQRVFLALVQQAKMIYSKKKNHR